MFAGIFIYSLSGPGVAESTVPVKCLDMFAHWYEWLRTTTPSYLVSIPLILQSTQVCWHCPINICIILLLRLLSPCLELGSIFCRYFTPWMVMKYLDPSSVSGYRASSGFPLLNVSWFRGSYLSNLLDPFWRPHGCHLTRCLRSFWHWGDG